MTIERQISEVWKRLFHIDVEARRRNAQKPPVGEHLKMLRGFPTPKVDRLLEKIRAHKRKGPSCSSALESEVTEREANQQTAVTNPTSKNTTDTTPTLTAALPQKAKRMKRNEAFPSKFLKAADINGRDVTATISSVEWEQVGKEKTSKPVLRFSGRLSPLILNGTNWDAIVRTTGEEDSENWEGKEIILYSALVQFGGELVDAIRIRDNSPKKPERPKAAEPLADDDIPPF
jgi:hypothetical protein